LLTYTMTKTAVKQESCAWPDGKDFIESCNLLSSTSAVHIEMSNGTFPPFALQFTLCQSGLQVSIKCGRGVEASALRVRFTRMFPVKATQYLRKIEPAFEAARAVTLLQPSRGRLHASTSRRRMRTGKRVAQSRSLVETVSPV